MAYTLAVLAAVAFAFGTILQQKETLQTPSGKTISSNCHSLALSSWSGPYGFRRATTSTAREPLRQARPTKSSTVQRVDRPRSTELDDRLRCDPKRSW